MGFNSGFKGLNYSQNEKFFRQKMYRKSKLILRSITFFFRKIVPFMQQCEKYGTSKQATDNNVALAHCMLDN
jgi:hypothetical protein